MIGIIGYAKISMFGIMKGKGGLYEKSFYYLKFSNFKGFIFSR